MELFNQIIEENLNVRMVEALVKDKKNGTRLAPPLRPMGTDWDPDIDRIIEEFHKRLRASVHLKNGNRGKGKIIISYKNREDLERILSLVDRS
jgi:ParB family chromosome partitioning protein